MAGPTVLDNPEVTGIFSDDVLYIIRGLSPGRDRWGYLRNILRSIGDKYLSSGGTVVVNTDTAKYDVATGDGFIGGKFISWIATTSAALTAAAASKHRIDVVVINSDGTITTVAGAESLKASTNPVFPAISTTQMSLAALYIDDTGAVDLTDNIYQLRPDNDYPNYYIKQAKTLYQGRYQFNNFIIDAAITIDCSSTSTWLPLQRQNMIIKCEGNLYITSNGVIDVASSHGISPNGNNGSNGASSLGGAGGIAGFKSSISAQDFNLSTSKGGAGIEGGGGGGGSIIASGGAGGADSGLGDGTAVNPVNSIMPFLILYAYNMNITGDILLNGENGVDATSASRGGSGGNAGGILYLIAQNDFTGDFGEINVNGGDGGAGGITDGGGGGGGAAGLILIRSKSYSYVGNINFTGGAGGGAPGVGTLGSPGSSGIFDQTLYNSRNFTDFTDLFAPLNVFGIDM